MLKVRELGDNFEEFDDLLEEYDWRVAAAAAAAANAIAATNTATTTATTNTITTTTVEGIN